MALTDMQICFSQRDPTQFYDHIAADRESIVNDIKTFFREFVQNRFQSKNYVFDVIRLRKDKVKLVDFNPFGTVTDSQVWPPTKLYPEILQKVPTFYN